MKTKLFYFWLFVLSISLPNALCSQSQRGFESAGEGIDQLLLEKKIEKATISYARFKTDTAPQFLNNSDVVLKKLLQMRNDDELRPMVLPS